MNEFLKSKRLYMLFVLPFIVMAIAFCSGYFPSVPIQAVPVKGIINLAFLNEVSKLGVSIISFVMVLGVAYIIFFINKRYKFLSQQTTLPSLIYVLLTSGLMVNLGFEYLLISVFLVAIAMERLQAAICHTKNNEPLYAFGFLIVIAVAIYPKFILLLVWAFCVSLFSGRSTLKDIIALLLGVLTPLIFITFYYFWTDRLLELPAVFVENLLIGDFIHQLPVIELVRLAMLVSLMLMALYKILAHYPVFVVNQRRGILSLVSMLFFLSMTFFVIPGNYYDFMYIIALPLSYIYAQYFLASRLVLLSNLMFITLLAACFLTYLV